MLSDNPTTKCFHIDGFIFPAGIVVPTYLPNMHDIPTECWLPHVLKIPVHHNNARPSFSQSVVVVRGRKNARWPTKNNLGDIENTRPVWRVETLPTTPQWPVMPTRLTKICFYDLSCSVWLLWQGGGGWAEVFIIFLANKVLGNFDSH